MTISDRAASLAIEVLKGSVYVAPFVKPLPSGWKDFGYVSEGSTSSEDLTLAKVIWADPKPLTLQLKSETINAELLRLLWGGFIQPKENTMTVDRKNFVLKATPVKAEALAHKHIGSLVTVTLPSGAEITDILEGIHTSRGHKHVVTELQHVRHADGYEQFLIDPKSVVQVRRPRPAPKPAARKR